MPERPMLYEQIIEALAGYSQGVTVRELAADMGESEAAVRKALNWNMRHGKITRRMGEPVGASKPPYLYNLAEAAHEEEGPRMPNIREAMQESQEQLEEGIDEAEEGSAGDPGEEEQQPQQGPTITEQVRPDPVADLPAPAKGATNMRTKREMESAVEEVSLRTGHVQGGTFRVKRVPPAPMGFPPIEYGVIGKAFELNLVGSLEDHIKDNYGGGHYEIWPCDGAGNIYKNTRPIIMELAGVPKPQTEEGQLWADKYRRRLLKEQDEDEDGPGNGHRRREPSFFEMMERADSKAREASQQTAVMMKEIFSASRPTETDGKALDALRTTHREEMEKVRTDADKRVQDIKDSFGVQIKKYEEDIKALRDEVRTVKTDLTNAFVKEKGDLVVAHLAKVAEVREAHAKELKAVEDQAKKDIEVNKEATKQEARIKALEAGPKDINSEVQKGMIPTIIKIATEQAKKAAGIEAEDEPPSMMEALSSAVAEAGPDIMKRVASGIMTIVEKTQGVAPAPALPQRPANPQRPSVGGPRPAPQVPQGPLPGPARPRSDPNAAPQQPSNALLRERGPVFAPPPPPQVTQPVFLTDEQQLEAVRNAAGAQPVPPPPESDVLEPEVLPPDAEVPLDEGPPADAQEVVDPVQQATALRIRTFFEVVHTEVRIDSEAAAAWASEIPGTDFDLEGLYFKLPGKVRKAVAEATDWPSILANLGMKASDDDLLAAIQEHVDAHPEAAEWVKGFLEAGPWNAPDEEEEEEEEQGGGKN